MNFYMKKYPLIAVSLGLSLLFSCSDEKGIQQTAKATSLSVRWHSGYKMSDLLAQTVKISNIDDIKVLLDKKWYAEFSVISPASPDKIITLSTCRSYLDNNDKQLNTVRERDNAAFMEIAAMCEATEFIANGKSSKQTFLASLLFDSQLPDKLPAQLALVISEAESTKLLNIKKIKYWSHINKITNIANHNINHATYTHDGGSQELELVAKGDFNGDGIEDMLLTSRDSVEGGTYSATRLFMFTKLSKDAAIKLLEQRSSK